MKPVALPKTLYALALTLCACAALPTFAVQPDPADRVLSFLAIGSSPAVNEYRAPGYMSGRTSWQQLIDEVIIPQYNWGVRRFVLHNPFGNRTDVSPMIFDQYIWASERGFGWLVADFEQAWGNFLNDYPDAEVTGYLGKLRDVPPMEDYLNAGQHGLWWERVQQSMQPLLNLGMGIGFDATSGTPIDHPVYALMTQLQNDGVRVYCEAWPSVTNSHMADFNVMAAERFYDRHIKPPSTTHVAPENIAGEKMILVNENLANTSPGIGNYPHLFLELVRDVLARHNGALTAAISTGNLINAGYTMEHISDTRAPWTWTAGSGGGAWGASGNWDRGVPDNDGSAQLEFWTGGGTVDLGGTREIYGLTIADPDFWNSATSPGAFTFAGGTLSMGAGGLTVHPGPEQVFGTAASPVTFVATADQGWRFRGASLRFTGPVDIGNHTIYVPNRTAWGDDLIFEGSLTGAGTFRMGGGSYRFYGDMSGFSGELLFPAHSAAIWIADGSDMGNVTIRHTGENRRDFRAASSGEVELAANIDFAFGSLQNEILWSDAAWTLTGGVDLGDHGVRMRGGPITFAGEVTGLGGLVIRRGGGSTTVNFNGTHSYLGETLIDYASSRLEVNGTMTAGALVNDNAGGQVFQPAGLVTIASESSSSTTLRGSGVIGRDVLLVGAGQAYRQFDRSLLTSAEVSGYVAFWQDIDVYTVSGASSILDGSLTFGGTLTVNSASGSGSVTIADGGTLKGIGRIGGAVTVQSGGTLATGTNIGWQPIYAGDEVVGVETPSPVGTLSLNGTPLTLEAGSLSVFEIASASDYDRVEGIGDLTYGGGLAIVLLDGYAPEGGESFELFGFADSAGQFDGFDFSLAPLISGWEWSFDGTSGMLSAIESVAILLGDFNGDGVLSGLDIPGFKSALADPDGWALANPGLSHPNLLGDFNADGVFSGLDIPGFKAALAGGAAAVPEPLTALSAMAGAVLLLARRRQA